MPLSKRFAIISSTAGSVMQRTYQHDTDFRCALSLIISDRVCGASDFAQAHDIPSQIIPFKDPINFSDTLIDLLNEYKIDFAFLFFTRLLRGRLLLDFQNRIINFHLSLLPACPGLHGFENTISSGTLLAGSTTHFVDNGVDTGSIIQQTFVPISPNELDEKLVRHRLFLQQCASLSQICLWIKEKRLSIGKNKRVIISGGRYDGSTGFIPALESNISKQFLLDEL